MRVVTCIGNPKDVRTHSGVAYYLWRNGLDSGFIDDAWVLDPGRLRRKRLAWNIGESIRFGHRGGFQYTEDFLRALLRQELQASAATEVVSIFPLFPPLGAVPAEVSYYIDATQAQVFEDYGAGAHVSPRVVADALAREREHYAQAARIVCRSFWAGRSVVERYGVDEGKVHIIAGGANLDERFLPEIERDFPPFRPLRLGFIGKDWPRKNLVFLLAVAEELGRRGVLAQVVAAGFPPEKGPRHPLLHAIGFIDKARQMREFVNFVQSVHFGCLFSHVDASPRSNIEFNRLGVPVIASDVGGMADTVLGTDLNRLFARSARAGDVADYLERFVKDPAAYAALHHALAERAGQFSWAAATKSFEAVWRGSSEYSFGRIKAERG